MHERLIDMSFNAYTEDHSQQRRSKTLFISDVCGPDCAFNAQDRNDFHALPLAEGE